MPPVLDHSKSKVDGLAFLGLSLTRNSTVGHPDSITHQEAFDLNEVQDRDYEFIFSTNDDGWLVGGGEPGPPTSYKLAAKDTAHVEIMRIGTYRPEWGGVAEKDIIEAIESGKILIPQIEALPTAVVANPDLPPELEIRFDMQPPIPNFEDLTAPLPINWQLRFLHNQLFKHFEFPSRFCPGAFHSTILRKAEFRSPEHRAGYFAKCEAAIQKWHQGGPKPLNKGWDVDGSLLENPPEHTSGIFLFLDRQNITHSFMPNFLPPYDTPEKRKIILDFLKEEWDEKTLSWKPVAGAPNASAEHEIDLVVIAEEATQTKMTEQTNNSNLTVSQKTKTTSRSADEPEVKATKDEDNEEKAADSLVAGKQTESESTAKPVIEEGKQDMVETTAAESVVEHENVAASIVVEKETVLASPSHFEIDEGKKEDNAIVMKSNDAETAVLAMVNESKDDQKEAALIVEKSHKAETNYSSDLNMCDSLGPLTSLMAKEATAEVDLIVEKKNLAETTAANLLKMSDSLDPLTSIMAKDDKAKPLPQPDAVGKEPDTAQNTPKPEKNKEEENVTASGAAESMAMDMFKMCDALGPMSPLRSKEVKEGTILAGLNTQKPDVAEVLVKSEETVESAEGVHLDVETPGEPERTSKDVFKMCDPLGPLSPLTSMMAKDEKEDVIVETLDQVDSAVAAVDKEITEDTKESEKLKGTEGATSNVFKMCDPMGPLGSMIAKKQYNDTIVNEPETAECIVKSTEEETTEDKEKGDEKVEKSDAPESVKKNVFKMCDPMGPLTSMMANEEKEGPECAVEKTGESESTVESTKAETREDKEQADLSVDKLKEPESTTKNVFKMCDPRAPLSAMMMKEDKGESNLIIEKSNTAKSCINLTGEELKKEDGVLIAEKSTKPERKTKNVFAMCDPMAPLTAMMSKDDKEDAASIMGKSDNVESSINSAEKEIKKGKEDGELIVEKSTEPESTTKKMFAMCDPMAPLIAMMAKEQKGEADLTVEDIAEKPSEAGSVDKPSKKEAKEREEGDDLMLDKPVEPKSMTESMPDETSDKKIDADLIVEKSPEEAESSFTSKHDEGKEEKQDEAMVSEKTEEVDSSAYKPTIEEAKADMEGANLVEEKVVEPEQEEAKEDKGADDLKPAEAEIMITFAHVETMKEKADETLVSEQLNDVANTDSLTERVTKEAMVKEDMLKNESLADHLLDDGPSEVVSCPESTQHEGKEEKVEDEIVSETTGEPHDPLESLMLRVENTDGDVTSDMLNKTDSLGKQLEEEKKESEGDSIVAKNATQTTTTMLCCGTLGNLMMKEETDEVELSIEKQNEEETMTVATTDEEKKEQNDDMILVVTEKQEEGESKTTNVFKMCDPMGSFRMNDDTDDMIVKRDDVAESNKTKHMFNMSCDPLGPLFRAGE